MPRDPTPTTVSGSFWVVVGWTPALACDTPEGALPTIQLLAYANAQLLDFRHYDEVLTRLLADVYRSLEQRTGLLARWRLAREAERLNTIRLDVRELTERMDNSIKFLGDMFSARLYSLSAGKVGVADTAAWWTKSCAPLATCATS